MTELDAQVEQLGRSSRQAAGLGLLGLAVLFGSLLLGGWRLREVMLEAEQQAQRVKSLRSEASQLKNENAKRRDDQKRLREQVQALEGQKSQAAAAARSIENAVSTLLFTVLDESAVEKIAPGVNWERVSSEVEQLPPGRRKAAVLLGLLSTWRRVPQRDGGASLETGMDSPRFLNFILKKTGVSQVDFDADRRASDQLMEAFTEQTRDPQPGDLMFFRTGGACRGVGHPGCMYLAPGDPQGHGICMGSPHYGDILKVLDTKNLSHCEFVGYFKVPYEELD